MIGRAAFCAEFGIDEAAAAAALDAAGHRDAAPWYVRALLAFGAWIAAIAMIGFFGFLIELVLSASDGFETAMAILGLVSFASGLALLADPSGGDFRQAFATALAAAGAAMAAIGIGLSFESIWVSAVAATILAAIVVARGTGAMLQILVSGLAVASIAVALLAEDVPYYLDVAAVFPVAGVVLWTRPPRVDVRPTAFVLMLAGPALSVFARYGSWTGVPPGGLVLKGASIALFAWLLSILWRRTDKPGERTPLAVFAVAATAVSVILPPGGAGALVILTLAYVLGSRPLALFGALLQAWFFWQFYYDLAVDLLAKSLLLTAVGVVLLACWWLVAGRGRRPEAGA